MGNYTRRAVLGTAGAAGVAGLAGCLGGDGESGDGSKTIKLGVLMGLTGELGQLGPPIRDGATLAVDQVNDADVDVTVDVRVEDTNTDPGQGVDRAESLLMSDYRMVCGALSSAVSLEVLENVALPNEMVMCSPASTSPEFTGYPDDGYFFRTPPTDSLQGIVLADIAANRLGHDTASALFLDNTYGRGLSEAFVSAFEDQHGGTLGTARSFQSGRASYAPELEAALADDPDVLLVVALEESGVRILNDFYSNYDSGDVDILVSDGLRSEDVPADVEGDLSNVTGTSPGVGGPGLEEFTERYQEEYDREPGIFTHQAYDAAAALLLAGARADPPTGHNISHNMWWSTDPGGESVGISNLAEGVEIVAGGELVHYQGVSGPVNFDANGDLGSAVYDLFEFTADGINVVDQIDV